MLPFNQIKPAFAISLVLVSFTNYSAPISAQPNRPATHRYDRIQIYFLDGGTQGRPTKRVDTSTRGPGSRCPSTDTPLVALIPEKNIGLAVEENPTFWFYIPYKPDQITSGKFVLSDESGKEIYQTSLTSVGTPGLVNFRLPSEIPLEINKEYQWKLTLNCASHDVSVHGWVQRVAQPNLETQLQTATPRDRIALYAKNGIWYTALNDLAKLRISEPQNRALVQDWTNLLKDVGLETLANKPIVGSIKVNSPPERRQ